MVQASSLTTQQSAAKHDVSPATFPAIRQEHHTSLPRPKRQRDRATDGDAALRPCAPSTPAHTHTPFQALSCA